MTSSFLKKSIRKKRIKPSTAATNKLNDKGIKQMNTQENELLRNAVFNLEDGCIGIFEEIETLSDINTRFFGVIDDMNNAKLEDRERVIHMFREHRQTLRMLQKLLSYTTMTIKSHYSKIYEPQKILFDGLVRKEKAAAGKVGE